MSKENLELTRVEETGADKVFEELKQNDDISINFNHSYLQLVSQTDILDILHSPEFSTVFLKYKTDMVESFEEWVSDDTEAVARKLVSRHGRDISIGFGEKAVGEKLGWKYESKNLEMCRKLPMEPADADTLREKDLDDAVELMSKEWWNKGEAKDFLKSALKVDNSYVKAVKKDGKVVGLSQVSVSNDTGWITVTYVDESYRGQKIGSRLVQALANEAERQGAEKVCLGAEAESGAVHFYEKLGFEKTGFRAYHFKP